MQAISGYQITETLYHSPNSLVYRGRRSTDGQSVVLKILKESYPTPERIAWFKREYEVTRNVHLPGVTRIYGLEINQHHWVMVLEDFGGESLRRLGIAGVLSLDTFFTLAIKVADILGQIHQQQIMHKDINPANILLNQATGQVKLIDFGIATVLSRETTTFRNPGGLEGTLAYMSPEQAGRMNRAMDYRTDLYSLGVTFYELLTGQLPFQSDDPLEIVHSHIARSPTPPHQLRSDLPLSLSAIVLKLMAKNAEDRYQSAYGLKADLELCQRQWQSGLACHNFTPGQHDISDRFHIPQKLYGRETEIDILLSAFQRVSQGGSNTMLVSGYAGIGKSALVQEIYKPITRQRGYFISGKFDQFQRNIPYSAFIQAFRSLIHQLLTESEARIADWKHNILAALGNNGKVVIEVLPELELIIGPQPDIVTLGPTEAQNRLNIVFQNFIRVFTQPEHPLVIFLDDLQWADGASLKLIELLMTASDSQYLFLIGAYREHEVGPSHPLSLLLKAMRQANASIQTLPLAPLDVAAVIQLVADTLRCRPDQGRQLAELLITKTGGNPFFLNEFLKSLYIEGLISFNHPAARWTWDIEHIYQRDMTDNVVELMAARVQRLATPTQNVLKLAACIGNQFDLETLAVVYEHPPRTTASDLWGAVAEGLVVPLSDAYKVADLDIDGLDLSIKAEYRFAHDRIQQAAYSLIPRDDRQEVHLQVGRLLLESMAPAEREERIFDIVNHLNQGRSHLSSAEERDHLAELNVLAGQKAIASAAYEPALSYLRVGIEILTPDPALLLSAMLPHQPALAPSPNGSDGWSRRYELTLDLYKEYAKCAYLNGYFDEAERVFDMIIEKATSDLDKAQVYTIKMVLYTSLGKLQEVIEAGLEGLALLGLHLPLSPTQEEIDREIELVHHLIDDRPITELIHLPTATDQTHLVTMRLLEDLLIPAWWRTNTRLLYLVTLKMVRFSLQYGHTGCSAFAYTWYGMLLGSGLGDYQRGYEFGELALWLNEKYQMLQRVAKVNLIFAAFVQLWRYHLKTSLSYVQRGYQVGLETGDLVWAGINGYVIIYTMIIKGDELDNVYHESQHYLDFAQRTKQIIPINMLMLSQQFILCMKGLTREPGSFSDSHYNEESHIQEIQASEAIRPIFWYYKIKLQTLYLFEQYAEAIKIAQDLDQMIEAGAAFGNVTMPEHYFYYSLTIAALYPTASVPEQVRYWQTLTRNQGFMKTWSYHCPENFRHKYLLIEAEMGRLKGQNEVARTYYEQAIASAHGNEYIQNEAIASELAARFYLSLGQDNLARSYILEARNCYLQWGATAKVKALDKTYPLLLTRASLPLQSGGAALDSTSSMSTMSTPSITTSSGLDLSTVIKATQAISGEIVLETLLEKLIRILIENAGAELGMLLLERQGQWFLQAKGCVEQETMIMLQSIPLETAAEQGLFPSSIMNYVARTSEYVVLNDATSTGKFTRDPYIIANQTRSVLCAPLLSQGKHIGILYLENNLTTEAFTADRLEMLNMLAAQAAISIQNAVLYTTLEESESKYRTLFEDSTDTIYITAPTGVIIDINQAGLELFGYTRDEIQQINARDLYDNPADREAFRQAIEAHGSVRDYPATFRRKDGTTVDCLSTASVRKSDNGAIIEYQGIIRDITEQKRAAIEKERMLDQEAQRAGELNAILQNMADGLLVVDTNERIVMVNPVAADLLGQTADVLINKPLDTLTFVDDPIKAIGLQHVVEQVRAELADLEQTLAEGRITLGDRIVRLQSQPTLGRGSSLTGAVVVLQDITREVEADRAKSAFIGTASHEMRTPLASLKGFVDIFYLSDIDNLTQNQRLFLDTIKRQTDNLVSLVNDLLEVARLEQGTVRMERRWISIPTVIDESVTSLNTQITQRNAQVALDLAPDLPNVWIDTIHMRRIMTNLISNAVKYIHNNGSVWVRAYHLDDPAHLPGPPAGSHPWTMHDQRSVVIEVEDDGVGIREEDHPKIFQRFFRSENPLSVEAGGTGLGLAITQSLVALHNGQIGFRSAEGQGSCFWVRLPAPTTDHLEREDETRYIDEQGLLRPAHPHEG